jgi:large subunit ribosomal protein L20
MTRVKTGPVTRRRHKKILKKAKWFRWWRSNLFGLAKNAVAKAGQNAYRDRRLKKRDFRKLWIARINAYLRENNEKYSTFINKLNNKAIILNRKILADLSAQHPEVMDEILKKVS